MLIQFSVSNFASIKDEVVFSMVASNKDENSNNLIGVDNKDERVVRTTAIYGANASGKTNFMKAISSGILMVRRSNTTQVGEKLIEMIPFKFDNETKNKPCKFEFIFISNGIKYVYGFSADINKVYEEYLYKYTSAKPSLIFERTEVNKYKFIQADSSKLKEIETKNIENKLFLATATAWNYAQTKDAYMWFADKIDTYENFIGISDYNLEKLKEGKDAELENFIINLLKEADIVIKKYNVEVEDKPLNPIMQSNLTKLGIQPPNNTVREVNITTIHEIENESGEKEEFELNIYEESLGTQNLFCLSVILKDVFEKGKIIIIDEIDNSLHPLLVEYIVKLFHNTDVNKNNAQLIFNTHDTNMLNLELFRRDQIWFVEKDEKRGSTDVYPLDDFSVRKAENIQKGYLNGRYGAIPFISKGDSLWI